MGLIATPELTGDQWDDLAQLDTLRERLAFQLKAPTRWTGSLRRLARAEGETSSIQIEGFTVAIAEALEIIAGRRGKVARQEDEQALRCYHLAMDRVLSLAEEAAFTWSQQLLLDLHFMVCYFQPDKLPGRYRRQGIGVAAVGGGLIYQGPPSGEVPGLMAELVAWLNEGDLDLPPLVRAAMSHLNLVSIHPFADGNGRMARILQSMVLAREGVLAPELASIESYLAGHTHEYYAALQSTHGPIYDSSVDASQWVRFCIDAHMVQAGRLDARLKLIYQRNTFCEQLANRHEYPDRMVSALDQALMGLPVGNAEYRSEHGIAAITASNDLRRMAVDGWLAGEGAGRSARYRASERLIAAWAEYQHNQRITGALPGVTVPS